MDINFPTPQEELDLAMLRSAVNRHYQEAFRELRKELYGSNDPTKIVQIIQDTLNRVDTLAAHHEVKHKRLNP